MSRRQLLRAAGEHLGALCLFGACLASAGCVEETLLSERRSGGDWTLVVKLDLSFSHSPCPFHADARRFWGPIPRSERLVEGTLANDGGAIQRRHYDLRWVGDTALLTFTGLQEQADITYILNPDAEPAAQAIRKGREDGRWRLSRGAPELRPEVREALCHRRQDRRAWRSLCREE